MNNFSFTSWLPGDLKHSPNGNILLMTDELLSINKAFLGELMITLAYTNSLIVTSGIPIILDRKINPEVRNYSASCLNWAWN